MLLGALRELGLDGRAGGHRRRTVHRRAGGARRREPRRARVRRARRAGRRASSRRCPVDASLGASAGASTRRAARPARRADARRVRGDGRRPRARAVRRARHPSARARRRAAIRGPSSPRVPPPELHREVAFEPPLELADQVAFGMRMAADEFIAGLGALDLVCTELRVELHRRPGRAQRAGVAASGLVRRRGRRRPGALAAGREDAQRGAAAQRCRRWCGSSPRRWMRHPTTRRRSSAPGTEERVHHALSRVQAMLGHRGVLTPAIGGGRWLAERQVLVPWGDRAVAAGSRRSARGRGRGACPIRCRRRCSPSRVPVEVTGAGGERGRRRRARERDRRCPRCSSRAGAGGRSRRGRGRGR